MAKSKITGGKKLAKFLKDAKAAKGAGSIEAGFYKTAKYDDGTPVTNVAAWQEFGTTRIPERPFFRQAIKRMPDSLLPILKQDIDPKKMVIERPTAERLGQTMQGEIQQSIVRLREPANAASTKRRKKGKSNPLIDTGFLLGSATYQVNN